MIRHLFARLGLRREEDTGAAGERTAAEWLRRERGFAIVARNWRNPADRRDELDLVARDGEVIAFVEETTRPAGALVPGYHAVDERKKRAVWRAASAYLGGLAVKPATFRFDVVEVAMGADGTREVLHFENVPLFPKYFRP